MKGLLIKDIKLMRRQGAVLLAVLVIIAVCMGIVTDISPYFVVTYITVFLSVFTATTISYDEYDNCYLFLMTLPVTRKKYVNEKYVFGILITLSAWAAGMVIGTVMLIMREGAMSAAEWVVSSLISICIAAIFMSVMIPIRLKFDGEKARYVNLIIMGVILVLAFSISKLTDYVPEHITESTVKFFTALGDNGIVALSAVIAAVALAVSYICSRCIMEKKEF